MKKAAKLRLAAFCFCLGPTANCFLPTAHRSVLRGCVGFGCVVKLPRLDNVFLVVVNTVAVYVDADFDLVLLAVMDVAGIERKAVLAAQERIDRAEHFW